MNTPGFGQYGYLREGACYKTRVPSTPKEVVMITEVEPGYVMGHVLDGARSRRLWLGVDTSGRKQGLGAVESRFDLVEIVEDIT